MRPPSHFVEHLMYGSPDPANMKYRDFMYECFLRDIARGPHSGPSPSWQQNPFALRLVTFNVHFFRVKFSTPPLTIFFSLIPNRFEGGFLQRLPARLFRGSSYGHRESQPRLALFAGLAFEVAKLLLC